MLRVASVLLAITAALAATACGGTDEQTGGSGRLTEVSSVAPIAARFDEDKGRPRLLLLLSPT